MNINIYDEKLNRIAIIEERFVSCLWSEGYNTTENFTLEVQATEELKKKIKVDNFVGRDDRPTMMIIKSVEYRDKKIVATGKQATRILDDVALMGLIEGRGKPFEKQIVEAYDDLEYERIVNGYYIYTRVYAGYDKIEVQSQDSALIGREKDTSLSQNIKNNKPMKIHQIIYAPLNKFTTGDRLEFDITTFPLNIYADGMEIEAKKEAIENINLTLVCRYSKDEFNNMQIRTEYPLGKCLKIVDNQIRFTNVDNFKPFIQDTISEIDIETDEFLPSDVYDIPEDAEEISLDVGFFADKGSRCIIKDMRTRENTPAEVLTFKKNGYSDESKFDISNKSFLEICNKFCQKLDYGLKVTKQNNGLVAEFYKPEENIENIFSESFGNLKVETLLNSNENYKNYAIVLGGEIAGVRSRVDVDFSKGKQVNQMIVDARDLKFDEGDPWRIVSSALVSRGTQKLLEQDTISNVEFELSEKDFGTKYDLGDIVTARLDSFGLTIKARIVRFTQTVQDNATKTTVEIGNLVFLKNK